VGRRPRAVSAFGARRFRHDAGAATGERRDTVRTKGIDMNVRHTLGTLLAVPALALATVVGTATPGLAAGDALVAFAGTVVVTPRSVPTPTALPFCFRGTGCDNTVTSTGTALGASTGLAVVDGLRGTATYLEACTAGTGLAPTGSADITANVHEQLPSSWSRDVTATWLRVGLVAVIQGEATGAALFVPKPAVAPAVPSAPACNQSMPVQVIGAVRLTY
jgi:hypothetical protein